MFYVWGLLLGSLVPASSRCAHGASPPSSSDASARDTGRAAGGRRPCCSSPYVHLAFRAQGKIDLVLLMHVALALFC